jgi:hypothetical protein
MENFIPAFQGLVNSALLCDYDPCGESQSGSLYAQHKLPEPTHGGHTCR